MILIICNKPFLAQKNVFFKGCKILNLCEINELCVSAYIKKNINKFELIRAHDYLARNKGNLRNTRGWINISLQNIPHIGPKILNNLPYNIRNINKILTFKLHLKQYLLSLYQNL